MQRRPHKLPIIRESSSLDPCARPRPSLGRVRTSPALSRVGSSNTSRSTLRHSGTGTPRPELGRRPTVRERLAELDSVPRDKGPWHPDSAFYVPKKTWKEIGEDCYAWEAERKRRKEVKRLCRQLDGSLSRSNSATPSVTQLNSFRGLSSATQFNSSPASRVNSLKASEAGSIASAVPSSASANSGDSAEFNRRSTRLQEVVAGDKDDRNNQGYKAQEQQPREPDAGADCKQDTTPHGGQGQRGFFGRHKGKNPRYVFTHSLDVPRLTIQSERSSDIRPESMSRRDKFRSNFLTKDWRRHRRTQSNE